MSEKRTEKGFGGSNPALGGLLAGIIIGMALLALLQPIFFQKGRQTLLNFTLDGGRAGLVPEQAETLKVTSPAREYRDFQGGGLRREPFFKKGEAATGEETLSIHGGRPGRRAEQGKTSHGGHEKQGPLLGLYLLLQSAKASRGF